MGILRGIMFGTLSFSLLAAPVLAHHAFTAEFSGEAPIELKGVVTRADWINPHVYLYIDVKDSDGKVTTWAIEAGPTRHMRDAGITKSIIDATIGQSVTIWGYPAKDAKPLAFLKTIFFPDGHFLSFYVDSEDHTAKGEGTLH